MQQAPPDKSLAGLCFIKGNYFIIGDEPIKQNSKQHNTWVQVKASKFLEFVPSSETNRISEYMEEHSVQPYFDVKEA